MNNFLKSFRCKNLDIETRLRYSLLTTISCCILFCSEQLLNNQSLLLAFISFVVIIPCTIYVTKLYKLRKILFSNKKDFIKSIFDDAGIAVNVLIFAILSGILSVLNLEKSILLFVALFVSMLSKLLLENFMFKKSDKFSNYLK